MCSDIFLIAVEKGFETPQAPQLVIWLEVDLKTSRGVPQFTSGMAEHSNGALCTSVLDYTAGCTAGFIAGPRATM